MFDEISKKMLRIIYGIGIGGTELPSEKQIPPHRSSGGLQAIFRDIPKTSFYRKLKDLEREGYIAIKTKKRFSRKFEIINGQKVAIPLRYSKGREVQLTEKGKEIVSELLLNEFSSRIDVCVDQKVERILFVDAVEYLRTNFSIEIHTAFFYLLNSMEKRKCPIDLERLGREISKEI